MNFEYLLEQFLIQRNLFFFFINLKNFVLQVFLQNKKSNGIMCINYKHS